MSDPVRAPLSAHEADVERWTRLGRLIDSTPELDFAAVAEVLGGQRSYDDLGAPEGEVVLAVWQRRIEEGVKSLDFSEELEATGGPFYEGDADGKVFECWPGGVRRPVGTPDPGADGPLGE